MSATASTAFADAYRRSEDFESHVAGLMLQPEVWTVFAQFDRPATAADIATRSGLPAGTVDAAIELLQQHNLIRRHLLGWQDFLAAQAPAPAAPVAVPVAPVSTPVAVQPATPPAAVAPPAPIEPPAPVAIEPVRVVAPTKPPAAVNLPAAVPTMPAVPAPSAPAGVLELTLGNPLAAARRRALAERTVFLRIEKAPVAAPSRPRLRPLLDAIIAKGGGGLSGQFLAYRVFLKVPPELMQSAGIKSLNLIDDHFQIEDPRLHEAIRTAAREVAAVELQSSQS